MTDLLIFIVIMTISAILDMRQMRKNKLVREPIIYFALCACALLIAVVYFPELGKRSIMSYLLELIGEKV